MNVKRMGWVLVGAILFLGAALSIWPAAANRAVAVERKDLPAADACTYLGYAFGLQIDTPLDGTYKDGVLEVTLDIYPTGYGPVFDWSANRRIGAVIVKGSDRTFVTSYGPLTGEIQDSGLYARQLAGMDGTRDPYSELHQVSFCYDTHPSIQVQKIGDLIGKAGSLIQYAFVIINDGDVTLALESIIDDKLGDITLPAVSAGCDVLAPYTFCVFNLGYLVQPGDLDPMADIVTVNYRGEAPGKEQAPVSAWAEHPVNLFQPAFAVELDGDRLSKMGDQVDYTLTITNTSSADSPDLVLTSVEDALEGELLLSERHQSSTCGESLPAGAACSMQFAYIVQEGDPDPLANSVRVRAVVEGYSDELTAADSHSVELFQPGIVVESSGSPLTQVGEAADYAVTITNTSSADTPPLILDWIVDERYGSLKDRANSTSSTCSSSLEPGDSCSIHYRRTVLESADPLINRVQVFAHPDGFINVLSASAEHSVNLFQPSIALLKEGRPITEGGSKIRYTISLTNTSSPDTPDLVCTLLDPTLGIEQEVTLVPGARHVIHRRQMMASGSDDLLGGTASARCQISGFNHFLSDLAGVTVKDARSKRVEVKAGVSPYRTGSVVHLPVIFGSRE